jgi:hypothetical protein
MKGEMDRECRAKGGVVKDDRRQVKKAFKSPKPTGMAPDDTLERGAGPLFRKRGGKIEGKGKKAHMGRAGRKSGGGVGSDLKPLTSADSPRKPKDRKIMPESEATP